MAINTAEAYAFDQVPIEEIDLGDTVVTKQADGTPRVWKVHAKGFKYNKAAGDPPMITLRAEAEPGAQFVAGLQATVGTLMHRLVPAPAASAQRHTSNARTDTDETDEPDTNYRHPKCYANTRGGCSTKISGEHFISHGLIKLYSFDDPDFKIKHDTGYGIREFVSPQNFVANILCTNHNTVLHGADDAALAFARFLRTISLRFANGAGDWGGPEETTISGDDFQAWVLKLILNHVAGKAFIHQKGEFVSPFPPEAIDVLLGRAMWPIDWGLCVAGDTSNTDLRFRPFDHWEDSTTEWWSCQPFIHNDGWVGGGIVNLNGVGLGLTVFNPGRSNRETFNIPGNPLRGSIQRPEYMAWELDGVQKRINFIWNDCWQHKTITYTMTSGE